MTDFALDERLAANTEPVATLELSDLRLMNDARFPWLILVPRRPNLSELIDLERTDLMHLMDEIATASRALHAVTSCDKLNVGALGNVVSQLHVHLVARFAGDAAWPGPVWGSGEAVAYRAEARHRLVRPSPRLPSRLTTGTRDNMSSFFDDLPDKEASTFNGFAGNVIDRQSEHRDAQSVAAALADKTARLYLFAAEKAIYRPGSPPDPLFRVSEAEKLGALETDVVLLGWAKEGPRLAATLPAAAVDESDGFRILDLRSLAMEGAMPRDHLGAFAQARSLSSWHQRHQFCANCGAETEMVSGGYRRDCAACKTQHFPRTDPVAIMLVIKGERCVMGRKPIFAPGMYACLAGFIEPGETFEDAVRRETREESGIVVGRVRYFASQPWPFPSTLMIGCHCEALSEEITRDETELEDCRWFEREEVRRMIAGSHSDGLKLTNPIAIGNRIITAWAMSDG